jgi:phosphatidylinositol phospholipase C, delta
LHHTHWLHTYSPIDIKEEFTKARQSVLGRFTGHKKANSSVSQALVGPPTAAAMLISSDKNSDKQKVKMSLSLVALLVYTVGVKCRGINKKEHYAPEHVFSLSETTANKILKQGMHDLIKHTRTHVVRIYPKGLRFGSTNYEPHRYWSAGAQLVAINWQTFGGYPQFTQSYICS